VSLSRPVTRFEIWFLSDDRISVFLETDQETGPIHLRELLEITTVAALAAGVIANLPKDLAKPLCIQLADFSTPETQEDIPTRVDDLVLVLPGTERGRKGFEGTLKMKGGLPVARWKPRGFRLFGREVQDYSQTAITAVLLHVIGGLSSNGRAMLGETEAVLERSLCVLFGQGDVDRFGIARLDDRLQPHARSVLRLRKRLRW